MGVQMSVGNNQPWLNDHDLAARRRQSRTHVWRLSQQGLLPPPIKLSRGCTRWLTSEVEAVDRARIEGADDEAVRFLIQRLVADRQAAAA